MLPAPFAKVANSSLLGSASTVLYQRFWFMLSIACHASVDGLNELVRVSNGLPPAATIRPSSSVETPAQNMSWKLLLVVWNVLALGSNTEE